MLVIGLSSCHKCIKCTETSSAGDPVVKWPETCGKKSEIEAYQAKIKAGVNPGNSVNCTSR
jgi:hypothetical protein